MVISPQTRRGTFRRSLASPGSRALMVASRLGSVEPDPEARRLGFAALAGPDAKGCRITRETHRRAISGRSGTEHLGRCAAPKIAQVQLRLLGTFENVWSDAAAREQFAEFHPQESTRSIA